MEGKEDKRLFLLDAFALIFRAYFAFIRNPLINSKGINTSAIQGFTNTLFDLIRREKPTHIAVVFDTKAPTFRAEEHDFYKANRLETPVDIVKSVPYIRDIIKAFNIPILEADGYEADDVIGTLAKSSEKNGYKVFMVTPDKDFGQLVSENIYMFKPPYGGKGSFDKIGPDEVLEKWDIERVDQVIDILGLMGDAVDNIPGVPGVGAKTAAKLLKEFDTVEGILENTDKIKGKLREKIEENTEQAIISKKLATIIIDVPVEWTEEDLLMEEPDKEKLAEIFNELEFRTLGKRILGQEFSVAVTGPEFKPQISLFPEVEREETEQDIPEGGSNIETVEHDYQIVDTLEKLEGLMNTLNSSKEFCFDTETTSVNPLAAELVGISFSVEPKKGFYVPVPPDYNEALKIVDQFTGVFGDKTITKIGQNIKYDILVMKNYGIEVAPPYFDTMLAHYLIEPDLKHNMDFLSETYLGYHPVSIETLIGKKGKNQGSMRDVPIEKVSEYAVEDADITLQLRNKFAPMVIEKEVGELFNDVEVPLVPVLADMEFEGINLNTGFLEEFSGELGIEVGKISDKIFAIANAPFNLDSPKQLGDILFNHLKIPYSGSKTKTGQFSTNEDTLRKLEHEYEICGFILDYREMVKLKSTYVDALPKLVSPKTGRIHTTYNQAVANTGRLSSTNPNLQNIPVRTERGRKVREAFIPRSDEFTLLSADYSQIELRIIAALSEDEKMINAFKNGEDIHAATAAKVFNVGIDEVGREMRSKAKAVNFGIAYGQTAFGLSQNLGIPRKEAAGIIESYFEQFPGIKIYKETSVAFAKEHGYARTMLNRKKYLKDINSANHVVRGFAERNSINMPIQGTAADMIKVAMIQVHNEMKKQNLKSKMLLQVHDELVFDAYKPELEALTEMVKEKMKNAIELNVPVEVDSGHGSNWLEAH